MLCIIFVLAITLYTQTGSHSYSVESIYHEKHAKIAGISKKVVKKLSKLCLPLKFELSKVVINLDLPNQIIIAGQSHQFYYRTFCVHRLFTYS